MISSIKTVITFLLIALPAVYVNAERTGASLRGANSAEGMKLYWETYNWPKNLYGFNLKKQTDNLQWELLNPEVIYPQVAKRDWRNLGLTQQQAADFDALYGAYLSSRKIKTITKEDFLSLLHKYGLQSGDRGAMKENYNLALIYGFGFIDSSYNDSEDAIYGLFFVDEQGQEHTNPAATFKPAKNIAIDPTIRFSVKHNKIVLDWVLSEQDYMQAALAGFKVYRQEKGVKVPLSDFLFGFTDSKDGNLYWHVTDNKNDPTTDGIYTVIPSTIFQSDLTPVTVKYISAEHVPIDVPSIDAIEQVGDRFVSLSWKGNLLKGYKNRIADIYIERNGPDVINGPKVKSPISLDSTTWIDTSPMEDGETYFYYLVVIDTQNKTWVGESGFITYQGINSQEFIN